MTEGLSPVMVAVMAARMLGVKEVPTIRLSHLSEVQRRALIIADNKIAENAGWNDELLRQELQALDGEEFDLGLLGFNDEELEAFLNGDADGEGLTDENAAPEVPEKPVSVLGDLWLCGDHKILCGDSTLIDSLPDPAGRGVGRHGVHRSALQRQLCELGQGQDARQIPSDPERQSGRGFWSVFL
jgi:hypothetical protein